MDVFITGLDEELDIGIGVSQRFVLKKLFNRGHLRVQVLKTNSKILLDKMQWYLLSYLNGSVGVTDDQRMSNTGFQTSPIKIIV